MNIDEYLIRDDGNTEMLYRFAFLGKREFLAEHIQALADLAEKENWTTAGSDVPNEILLNYIVHTFGKAAEEDLVLINPAKSYACFNTGLITENGEDIIALFNQFNSRNDRGSSLRWHLYGFLKESDRELMNNFSETPAVVSYFSDPSDLYFDPNRELVNNLDHILDDNLERFPEALREKGPAYIGSLLPHAMQLTLKRCRRNYRIVVPQYYRNQITYLLPVYLDGYLMCLAVEEINKRYRVNTVLTLEMAYKNARLLMKPESDWLTVQQVGHV